jgi:predicted transcriptional regulator
MPLFIVTKTLAARLESALLNSEFSRTLNAMEVHFVPELQAEIDQLAIKTGRAPDKLVEDAMAGYVAELAATREMLDSRYDDLKSGKVTPLSREEVIAHFREKSAAARQTPPA